MGSIRLHGALPGELVTTTTVAGGIEALDVNIASGSFAGSEYADDSAEFIIGTSDGTAIMAVFNNDPVNAGDIGVLSMTIDRKLRVDGTFSSVGTMDTDDDSIATTQDAQIVIPLLYGYDSIGGVWQRCTTDSFNILKVHIADSGNDTAVFSSTLSSFEDEQSNALAVSAGNYGYWNAGVVGGRLKPFLVDTDDGTIANDQTTQLVIPLNYYYNTNLLAWSRWSDGAGPVVNLATGTSVGIDSPLNTDFKSFDHPDQEVNRIVWQDPPYAGGRKNDIIPVGLCKWQNPGVANTFSSYTTGAGLANLSSGPYEGAYCMDLYENSGGGLRLSRLPYVPIGVPFDMRPGYYDDKVLVLEGKCYCSDNYDPSAIYAFGFFIYDGTARQCFMIEIHQVAGVYNAYRCTADNASIIIGNVLWGEECWNYWKLEIYPPQYAGGQGFKTLTINGVSYPLGGAAGYAFAAGTHVGRMDIEVGTFLTAAPERNDALWDELACWTYYDEYTE